MDKPSSDSSRAGRRGFLGLAGAAALGRLPLSHPGGWRRHGFLMSMTSAAENSGPRAGSARGLPPLKITDVRVIVTCPDRNYVVVKILTSEPGLYGVGDATLNGRELAVAADLEKHIAPILIGRDPEQIEDTWQYLYRGPYWRGGPVQMTAVAGVDLALWDIKGKRAGMPVYQLLGGRTRIGALAYTHASGRDFAEVEDGARRAIERGFKCVRAQVAIPGLEGTYGTAGAKPAEAAAGRVANMASLPQTEVFEPAPYLSTVPRLFEQLIDYVRCDLGHIGGITAARKVAALAELFQVRTAWHGPGDIGPPTHAANVHVDVSIPNFGIQEMVFFPDVAREVISGGPEFKDGYMNVSDTPGLGCDVNEEAAKKYPYRRSYLPTARRKDGSVHDW